MNFPFVIPLFAKLIFGALGNNFEAPKDRKPAKDWSEMDRDDAGTAKHNAQVQTRQVRRSKRG